jgi:hypothetical protein
LDDDGRFALLAFGSVVLAVVVGVLHGRAVRREREALGVATVVFGGVNPPAVVALWRADRVAFGVSTALAVALVLALGLWRTEKGLAGRELVLAALVWAPTLGFVGASLASLWRRRSGR